MTQDSQDTLNLGWLLSYLDGEKRIHALTIFKTNTSLSCKYLLQRKMKNYSSFTALLLLVLLEGDFALASKVAIAVTEPENNESRISMTRQLIQSCPKGWKKASGTIFDSWPKPGSTECIKYSGCKWAGEFANIDSGNKQCCCLHGAQWLDGGTGKFACRFNQTMVKEMRVAATWDQQDKLLGKQVEIMIADQTATTVLANVLDLCKDSDCGGCCKKNTANGKYKLLDLEAQVACDLLGLNYSDPNFDVNNLNTPVNKRPKVNHGTMPLCYKVVGHAVTPW